MAGDRPVLWEGGEGGEGGEYGGEGREKSGVYISYTGRARHKMANEKKRQLQCNGFHVIDYQCPYNTAEGRSV